MSELLAGDRADLLARPAPWATCWHRDRVDLVATPTAREQLASDRVNLVARPAMCALLGM